MYSTFMQLPASVHIFGVFMKHSDKHSALMTCLSKQTDISTAHSISIVHAHACIKYASDTPTMLIYQIHVCIIKCC